jgi:hypothetical protein
MSYEDLISAIQEKEEQEALKKATRKRHKPKQSQLPIAQVLGKRSRSQELEEETNRIRTGELADFCFVLRFD